MNGGSHRNHENLVNTGYWEGSPPQGPSRGTAGQVRFQKKEVMPPRGALRGGGRTSQPGVWGHQPPSLYRFVFFMRNHLVLIITLSGAPPPLLGHPPVARVPFYLFAIV